MKIVLAQKTDLYCVQQYIVNSEQNICSNVIRYGIHVSTKV